MAGVSFDVVLDQVLTAQALAAVLRRAKDLSEPFDVIGARLLASTQYRFETGKGPDGKTWKPSARAIATHGQTLVKRGHLRDSLTYRASRDSLAEGSNLVYSRVHQSGGHAGRGHAVDLPARPYLGIDTADEAMIVEEIDAWIGGALP